MLNVGLVMTELSHAFNTTILLGQRRIAPKKRTDANRFLQHKYRYGRNTGGF